MRLYSQKEIYALNLNRAALDGVEYYEQSPTNPLESGNKYLGQKSGQLLFTPKAPQLAFNPTTNNPATLVQDAIENAQNTAETANNTSVKTVVGGTDISVDSSDPLHPIVNFTGAAGGVTSVFGRTGAVTAQSGDYNTGLVTESGNLYFTNARAIASTLTGYTSGAGTVSATDTILQAIQKLNGNTAALTTGVSSVNGGTGAVTVTVTGTSNRVTVAGGTGLTPTIDISSSYVGQNTITTLGTITTGVWNGTAIANANLANSTISGVSLGSNLASLSISAELISGGATTYNGSTAKSIAIQPASVTNAMLAGSIDLTTKVTGQLPIANGGTAASTASGARINLQVGWVEVYPVWNNVSPSASTTYYAGVMGTVNTTQGNRKIYCIRAGTIKTIRVTTTDGSGTANLTAVVVEKNGSTAATLTSIATNGAYNSYSNTVTIAMTTSDYIEFKLTTPSGTAPTALRLLVQLEYQEL